MTFLKTSDGGKAICLARHLWRRRRKKRMELRYCDTAFRSPTQQRKISFVPPDNKQTHPFHPNFSYSNFIVYALVKPNPWPPASSTLSQSLLNFSSNYDLMKRPSYWLAGAQHREYKYWPHFIVCSRQMNCYGATFVAVSPPSLQPSCPARSPAPQWS